MREVRNLSPKDLSVREREGKGKGLGHEEGTCTSIGEGTSIGRAHEGSQWRAAQAQRGAQHGEM